jgi:hypothetical protein
MSEAPYFTYHTEVSCLHVDHRVLLDWLKHHLGDWPCDRWGFQVIGSGDALRIRIHTVTVEDHVLVCCTWT